jgi:hypothetical protein
MTDDKLAKRCLGCLQMLPVTSFSLRTDRPGQRKSRCSACLNRNTAIWRALNPTYCARWREAHPDYMAAASREYRKRALRSTLRPPSADPEERLKADAHCLPLANGSAGDERVSQRLPSGSHEAS